MKRKHYDLIIAWANGAEIEFKDWYGNWRFINNPAWNKQIEYRVKPKDKNEKTKLLEL